MKLIVAKGNVVDRITTMLRSAEKAKTAMNSFQSTFSDGELLDCMLRSNEIIYKRYYAGALGALKANLDLLPEELAITQVFDEVPLDVLIKNKMDNMVRKVRLRSRDTKELTTTMDHWERYVELSKIICGYKGNCKFKEELFRQFYPDDTSNYVSMFATGYSEVFHQSAQDAAIKTSFTHTKTKDIWKNWAYFIEEGVYSYRIDGNYVVVYEPFHEMFRSTKNEGVYDKLKARDKDLFEEIIVDL